MLSWQFLEAAGAGRVFAEKVSGTRPARPDLERLIDQLRPGDVVIVTKYDRLSLSLHDLLGIVARIQAAGAGFLEERVEGVLHVLHHILEYSVCHVGDEQIMLRVPVRQKGRERVRGFSYHARMERMRRSLDQGILELDNNTAERGMRAIALGRKNYLFVGSETGGQAAAIAYTLIETAKLNDVDPQAWLAGTLVRLPDHKITRIDELLP